MNETRLWTGIEVTDPVDDKLLEDYLHRKSALSLGYRRVYVGEEPPAELDQTIAARARRALRWLVPGLVAAGIAIGMAVSINVGVNRYVTALVGAEKNMNKLKQEREEAEAQERAKEPISVIVDPNALVKDTAPPSAREQWINRIEELKRAGKITQAREEQKKFDAAFPKSKTAPAK